RPGRSLRRATSRRTPGRRGRSRAPRACAAGAPTRPCRANRRYRLAWFSPHPARLPLGIPAARGDESGGEPDRQVVVVVTFFVTSAPTAAAGAGRAERIEAA